MKTLTSLILATVVLTIGGCNAVLDVTNQEAIETNPNKRSAGTKYDDRRISTIVQHNINKAHPDLDSAHIDARSFNAVVLLTGEIPSEELKSLATKTAKAVANVRAVHNELVVRGNTSLLSRTNDTYVHSRVKAKLAKEETLKGADIKVYMEDSVAFMMGLVTKEQGEVAAHAASLASGVRRVVKLFEYLD